MDKATLLNNFSPYLFWDIDIDKFDLQKNKAQLTYKVVEFGQLSDWKNLLALLGEKEIKNIVVELKSLDKTTLSFLANYFDIDEKEFRCYTQKQSKMNFWNS